jgi:hypothetical protein
MRALGSVGGGKPLRKTAGNILKDERKKDFPLH